MAISLNGSSSYIDFGNVLDATVDMTVSAWVRRNVTGVRHEIISKEDISPTGWELSILSTNVFEFGTFTGFSYPVVRSVSMVTDVNNWYHITAVRDNSANLLKIYVNGVLEATSPAGSGISSSNVNLNIGRRPNNTRHFNGSIDDIIIYNRALNDKEVLSLYTYKGKLPSYYGLSARWIFNEGDIGSTLTYSTINNIESKSSSSSGSSLSSTYTIASGVGTNLKLIMIAGAVSSTPANSNPSSASFGSTSMTKVIGVNNTSGTGVGTAIFMLDSVVPGYTNTVTVTYPSITNSRMMIMCTLADISQGAAETTASNYSNTTSTSLTISTINRGRLVLTGGIISNDDTMVPTGTEHIKFKEVKVNNKGNLASGYIRNIYPTTNTNVGFTAHEAGEMAVVAASFAPSSLNSLILDTSEFKYHGFPFNIIYTESNLKFNKKYYIVG